MKDLIPIVIESESISIEAIKAQRDQHFKDLAAFRARHAKAYRDWSSPNAIKIRRDQEDREAAAALERAKAMSAAIREDQLNNPRLMTTNTSAFKITPIVKVDEVKTGWFEVVKDKLCKK